MKSESKVTQLCLTFCNSMDCSLPGSSIHGIFQAGVLEWVAISFSRGSAWPRDLTGVSRIADRLFTIWATREARFWMLRLWAVGSMAPNLESWICYATSQQILSQFQSRSCRACNLTTNNCPMPCEVTNWFLIPLFQFSNVMYCIVVVQLLVHAQLFETPWLPHPSPSPRVCSDSGTLSPWCHPITSSSVIPFSCLQSFPASGSFPMSQLFASGDQSTGASASVLPMNIQSKPLFK